MTHGTAFSGRVGWGDRPAVVVVDMVRAYFDDGGPLQLGSRTAVTACAALVDAARAGGHPVVWTVVRYGPDARDAGWFVHKVPALRHFADGAPGAWGDVVAPLAPAPEETVVVKQYASAFFATSLASTLLARGVDTAVVCGVSTSGCVRASATDALQHGFRPIVVREACADRSAALHDNNLVDLDAKYADVVDLAEACARLGGPDGDCGGAPRPS